MVKYLLSALLGAGLALYYGHGVRLLGIAFNAGCVVGSVNSTKPTPNCSIYSAIFTNILKSDF